MIRTTNKWLEYGGSASKFYWTNVSVSNALPNCTHYCYGRCQEEGVPVPMDKERDASIWHKNLQNGWTYIKYDPGKVHVGDIIEWSRGNHVAYVEKISNGIIYISGSFYTGDHGKSYYKGKYDERSQTTYQQVSDYYLKNYSYRFFHYVPVETESSWCGYSPDYILVSPKPAEVVVTPVEKDIYTEQIYISTNEQNVRDNSNKILGIAAQGFYNILSTKEASGYIWYEVEKNKFVAGVSGRVTYIPAEAKPGPETEIDDLRKQLNALTKEMTSTVKSLQASIDEKESKLEFVKEHITAIQDKLSERAM